VAPWLSSSVMATRRLQWAFPILVFSYVGGETRRTHLGGPLKAASTEKGHATMAGFAQASVKAQAHSGGPLAMGQGMVVASWPPCRHPQVRDTWRGFKQRDDGEVWWLGFALSFSSISQHERTHILAFSSRTVGGVERN
jgi:hypothetical protein